MTDNVDSRLQNAIAWAYAHSKEVRNRFDGAGIMAEDVQTIDDLAKVPVREKDEVIALQSVGLEPPVAVVYEDVSL